ncbi:SusC/RagA family TonB-linked outer membrane protein [Bacteroides sp. AN502(2024)]|uniref:SusC/RagA family TonB-linked outer membrane protein n=1 Tax=Bacteroides sp. AN502(2024) TaxID=3160599 RepID=UPI0035166274
MKQLNVVFIKTTLLLIWGAFLSVDSYAQQFPVKGAVKDVAGDPIIGANIVVKGGTVGVITDLDGNFSLSAGGNDVLVVSYIGYKTKEVGVSSKALVITLEDDSKQIDEVVVIGYGSTRKQDLSTAVSTVKVDQSLKSRPANLGSYLQGRMPGVMIQSNGGDPLAKSTLSIRGRGSRGTDDDYSSGDAVLYVVDGVPGAPFNMEDVETISVLKDAASAAIYGASVGSGGVVVITTKQAAAGKLKVNVNISKSMKNAWRLPSVLTAEQYNRVWADATKWYGGKLPNEADSELFPYGAVTRTDWLDEIFRTGSLEHYALSLSGGSDAVKGFASFSYDKEDGILENTYSKKFGAKMNVDFQPVRWLKVGERVTFRYQNGQGNLLTGHQGVLSNAVFFPRSASVHDYDEKGNPLFDEAVKPLYQGTVPRWAAAQGLGGGYGEIRNPVAMLQRLNQDRPSSTVYSTTSVELKPVSGLTVKSDFTAGLNMERLDEFIPRVPEIGRPSDENERDISNTWNNNWLWETTVTYAKMFAEKHHVSAMAGYTMKYEKYKWDKFYTSGYELEDKHSTTLGQAGDWKKTKPQENIWEESMVSVFGRVGYSFDDRYFFTASIRRDATSKLYKDNNSGIFPAFSASWKISSEPFFKPMRNVFSMLKLRGSWGQIGNVDLVPRYSWNVPLSEMEWPVIYGKNLDNVVQGGVYASSIGVKNLKWETTEQLGVGLDMGLFDNSLNLTVDYFHKKTKDLIERVPIPSVAGIAIEPYGNIGSVVNRGWEIGADYTKTIGHVTVGLNANIATVHNEVTDLGSRETMEHPMVVNSLKPLRSTVGKPWYSYYVLKTEGIFRDEEEINNFKWTDLETGITRLIQPNAKPGDFKYVDFNNDGRINDDDKQYMGSYLPKLTFGFGGNLRYKGFDFSIQFQGVGKSTIYNGFKQMGLTGRQQGGNMLSDILNAWDYNNASGIPRLALVNDSNGNFSNASDFYLENGSYLRLKNMTLGYTLPDSVMRKIGLPGSSLRIYLNGENLCTLTDYTGFDPEVGNFGIDGGTYPVARTFSLGVNFNF